MNLLLLDTITSPAQSLLENGDIEALDANILQNIKPTILLLGPLCNVVNTPMPIKQARQIIKALPFALEEQLANEVENNHLLYIGRSNGNAHALTIQHSAIAQIIEAHQPDKLYFLPMLLPWEEGEISALIINGYACIRFDEHSAFSVPSELLPLTLEKCLNPEEEKSSINICYAQQKNELLDLQLENLGLEVKPQDYAKYLTHIKTQSLNHSSNLLSGDYKIKIVAENKPQSKFKPLITLAASLVILMMSINFISASQQNTLASKIQSASKDFYVTLFPDERVRGLKRQFAEKLETGSNTSNGSVQFTQILAKSAREIKNSPDSEIQSIRFTSKKGVLEISVLTKNVAQLDAIKQKLEQQNLNVEIASANNDGKKTKGLLKVSYNG